MVYIDGSVLILRRNSILLCICKDFGCGSFTLTEQHRYHTALQIFKSLHQIPLLIHITVFSLWRIWQVMLAVMSIVFLSPECSPILGKVSFIEGWVMEQFNFFGNEYFWGSYFNYNWSLFLYFCFVIYFLLLYYFCYCNSLVHSCVLCI